MVSAHIPQFMVRVTVGRDGEEVTFSEAAEWGRLMG